MVICMPILWLSCLYAPVNVFLSICMQTRPQATVEVEISEDMQVVHFDFNRFVILGF
jgi:hypothetical protein